MRTATEAVQHALTLPGTSSLINGTAGWCSHWTWDIYGRPDVRIPSWANAADQWRFGVQHYGTNYPVGAILYLGARPGNADGDSLTYVGDGYCVASDYPHNGVFGTCTLQQREAETGRTYVGWLSDMLGNPINFDTPQPTAATTNKKDDNNMLLFYIPKAAKGGQNLFIIWGPGTYYEFTGQAAANSVIRQLGTTAAAPITRGMANDLKTLAARYGK